VIAQAQAWSLFNGEFTVRADFPGRDLQMAAQGVGQPITSRQGARRRAAHTHDGSTHRFPVKHCIKIDDTMHIGERHAQGVSHFHCGGLGNPAMEMLCSVEGRQERSAALRRQLGEQRAQANQISIRHLL
jgi:hypothetical protein